MSEGQSSAERPLLEEAWLRCSSGSEKERARILKKCAAAAKDTSVALSEKDIEQMAIIAFATINRYTQRKPRSQVEDLIRTLVKNESTADAFVSAFLQLLNQELSQSEGSESPLLHLPRTSHFVLLRWTALVLELGIDSVKKAGGLAQTVTALARLLCGATQPLQVDIANGASAVPSSRPRLTRAAVRRMRTLFARSPEVATACASFLCEQTVSLSDCNLRALVACLSSYDAGNAKLREKIVSAYCQMIVMTKSRLCRAELDAFSPFVASLTPEEQEIVGPQLVKAVRRDTTHTVMVCVHFVRHSQQPPEADLLEMCGSALPSLTSGDSLLRGDCRDLVRGLISASSDNVKDKAMEKVIAAISDRRAPAEARLETMQLASSLSEEASNLPNIDQHIVALLKVVRSASSDAERLEILMSLAHWTATLPSPPKELVANYASGIKNQQQRSLYLTSLAVASRAGQTEFESLAGELSAIAKKSSALQAKRYDQLAALATLVNLSKESDLPAALLAEDSFAYTFEFALSLGARQTAVLSNLAAASLARDGVQKSLIYRLLARLLSLPGKGRLAVVTKVKALTTGGEGSGSSDLICALLWVMGQLGDELRSVSSKKQVAISNALGNSIRAIFHGSVTEDSAARFLQLVSQPIVSRSPAVALALFHTGTGPNFKDFTADQLCEASTFIMRCLFSEGRIEQRAGQLALSLLSSTAPSGVKGIAELLLARVKDAKLLDLSEEDIELYRTPEGELYDKTVAGTTYQSRSKSKKVGDDDDEDQSSRIRKTSAGDSSKRGGKVGRGGKAAVGPTKEELLQKAIDSKLEEESLVREVISKRVLSATQALVGLRALSLAPAVLGDIIPIAFETVFALLPHPVVHSFAFGLLQDMANSAGYAGVGLPALIATLENRLYGTEKSRFTHMDIAGNLVTVFDRLYSASEAGKLSVPGVFVGGPVIDYAVRTPTSFKMQDQGIRLIDSHSSSSQPAPRPRFLRTLLSTIDTAPRLADRCRGVIVHLGEGICTPDAIKVLFGKMGIKSNTSTVRLAAIECLAAATDYLKQQSTEGNSTIASYLWLAQSDPEEPVARTAAAVWSSVGAEIPKNSEILLEELYESDPQSHLAKQCAAALASAGAHYEQTEPQLGVGAELIQVLQAQYEKYLPPAPVITPRGYEFGEDSRFESRQCIAIALGESAHALRSLDAIEAFFSFLATKGPLMDGAEGVRQAMIDAGTAVVVAHGEEHAAGILYLLEQSLKDSDAAMTGALLREANVVFMGGLARFFKAGDPQVVVVLDRLLETLNTPSDRVQSAIADCLTPLMKMAKSEDARVLDMLFDRIVNSEHADTHVRNGAARGIAGVIKGLGNVSFKKHGILDRLKIMLEDKRSFSSREGALMTVEYLAARLQRLFEPYTVQLIDPLLKCYGDSSLAIRERTDHTAKAIMSTLRPSGVSFILPGVIAGLDAVAWRPKKAAVELLGAMAFCAPRQLGLCLPQIMPPLLAVLSDSHEDVRKSGQRALGHIASVIRNPEVQVHIPALLKALNNPEKYSQTALAALINTNFVHVIDAPSLALIMPLLDRSLRSSDMTVKRQAARIAGHMTTLADHKALLPYLDVLLPNIKATLVDANPETRSVSAVALGYLVDGLGEDKFPDIVAWLLSHMVAPESTVVRSGAAQGLSQVIGQMDIHRFDAMLPKILLGASSQQTHVREGSVGYFVFAPSSMGKRMEPYLRRVLPVVLHGLADEAETVRDISVRATQAIVAQYAVTSLDILLPCLEDGLFDPNWRIRQSSVQLMGDLLFKISGEDRLVPDVATMSDDDGIVKASESQIAEALGESKYKKVLSAIYMIRSDVSPVVRQQSLIVWKSVVNNTPKTLERILSVLMSMIIKCLGSSNDDRRYIASRTMGELVRKLGDRILPSIIPILEEGLTNGDAATRQGVCLGLTEVLNSAPRKQLEGYLTEVIPTVQKALADPLPEVREAAAKAFDTLIQNAGSVVIDNTVPSILTKLDSEETSENAINALKEVLGVRSKVILPQLLPKLLEAPLTPAKSQALVTVAEESGRALNKYMSNILKALVSTVAEDQLALDAASAVVVSVEEDGMHFLLSDLLTFAKDKEQSIVRQGAAVLIQELCSKSEEDISQAVPQLLQTLLYGLMDSNEDSMKAHSAAIPSCVKAITKEREGNYLADIRRHLKYCKTQLAAANKPLLLPGFCLPNGAGVAPLLPLFLGGLRSPSSEVRENAALGLGDIISLSSKEALQKQLRLVIGGLIRGVGDRFPGNVKAAILATMGQLLDKSEVATIKSFMVMMQTTFIKNLNDPSQRVREQAGANLGKLITLGTKVDPLVNELLNGVTNAQDEYKETMVLALYNVMCQESSLGERILANAETKLFALLDHTSMSVRTVTCKAIGAFARIAPAEQFSRVLESSLRLEEDAVSAQCFCHILMHASDRLEPGNSEVLAGIQKFLAHPNHDVQLCGLRSITAIISGNAGAWSTMSAALMPVLILEKLPNGSSDIRILSLRAIKLFAKKQPNGVLAFLDTLVPELMTRVKDRTALPVKLAAERAMLHALQINKDPSVLETLLQSDSLAAPQQTAVRDYCKRILSKLPADSDDES